MHGILPTIFLYQTSTSSQHLKPFIINELLELGTDPKWWRTKALVLLQGLQSCREWMHVLLFRKRYQRTSALPSSGPFYHPNPWRYWSILANLSSNFYLFTVHISNNHGSKTSSHTRSYTNTIKLRLCNVTHGHYKKFKFSPQFNLKCKIKPWKKVEEEKVWRPKVSPWFYFILVRRKVLDVATAKCDEK